ncbi:MAG: hypothetical protein FWH53_00175 [Leptospirales bacterium]|nr:hypothetical protein [Leptospirales bacterium]
MSYNDIIKSNAYMLYAQGYSFRQIADILKTHPGCEKLTHNTVKSWALEKDNNGLTWDDRKKEVTDLIQKKETETVIQTKRELIEATQKALSDIMTDILSGSLGFKTKDAAVYAFKTLFEWQDKVIDKEKRITIEEQVEIVFEAMHEIAEVSEVLLKHEKAIMAKWQEKALARIKKK